MKAIVFIGSNQFGTSREALTIAKEMGYIVILFTNKEKKVFPEVDHFIVINDILDEKKVLAEITSLLEKEIEICACISFIDPFVSYAAKLSKQLGLVNISADSLYLMENKIRVRDKLKDLPSSPFYTVFHHDIPIEQFVQMYKSFIPLIIKPPSSNGSKNVLLVDTIEKFENGLKFLQKRYSTRPVLVEEYLPGPQFLIEIMVQNNEMTVIAVIKQEITNNGKFIVIGYLYPAMLKEDEFENLLVSVQNIINLTGLNNGSCHLEMRLVQGVWKLIEINPRMSGGVMNRMIEEGTGINLAKEILRLYLGEQPSIFETRKQYVYVQYITISSRGKLLKVTGKDQALQHQGVKYVFVKPAEGSFLSPPHSMGDRYACIIATSSSPEQAKDIAIAAAKEIKFYLEPF